VGNGYKIYVRRSSEINRKSKHIAEAIRAVNPFRVDVASGVEKAPGQKDLKLVQAFITAAKN